MFVRGFLTRTNQRWHRRFISLSFEVRKGLKGRAFLFVGVARSKSRKRGKTKL